MGTSYDGALYSKYKNQTIIDIGANLGLEAIKLYELYPDSKIILIEPVKINYDHIIHYIKANFLENNWTAYNCAVDIEPGVKQFGFHHFIPDDDRVNGSLDPFNWERWNYEGTTTVECKTLSDICLSVLCKKTPSFRAGMNCHSF
jgi:FkbM family methyltransferase